MERESRPQSSAEARIQSRGDGVYVASRRSSDDASLADARDREARLMKVVSGELAPRLRLVHPVIAAAAEPESFAASDIAAFGALTILADNQAAFSQFAKKIDEGRSPAFLFQALLAPTADYLDDLLEQDHCDLVDFAMGMARLKQLLIRYDGAEERPIVGLGQKACLCAGPGLRRLFDRDLLKVVLRAEGWDVLSPSASDVKEARAVTASEACDVFALTLGAGSSLESAAGAIGAVRRRSRNRSIRVMAFGAVFAKDPGLAVRIGADAAAHDASSAVIVARALQSVRAA